MIDVHILTEKAGEYFAASKKSYHIFGMLCLGFFFGAAEAVEGWCIMQTFFMLSSLRANHIKSCYYVSHNGLNHEHKILLIHYTSVYCCRQQLHHSRDLFSIVWQCTDEITKRIHFNSIKHILFFSSLQHLYSFDIITAFTQLQCNN